MKDVDGTIWNAGMKSCANRVAAFRLASGVGNVRRTSSSRTARTTDDMKTRTKLTSATALAVAISVLLGIGATNETYTVNVNNGWMVFTNATP